VPPANTDDMGDSYRPLVSYDMGVAGANKVTLSKTSNFEGSRFREERCENVLRGQSDRRATNNDSISTNQWIVCHP
jgi:hypothetical protein